MVNFFSHFKDEHNVFFYIQNVTTQPFLAWVEEGKHVMVFYYTPTTKCGGGGAILDSLCRVGLSVGPSVRLQFVSAL